jgi:hypothetical protein
LLLTVAKRFRVLLDKHSVNHHGWARSSVG